MPFNRGSIFACELTSPTMKQSHCKTYKHLSYYDTRQNHCFEIDLYKTLQCSRCLCIIVYVYHDVIVVRKGLLFFIVVNILVNTYTSSFVTVNLHLCRKLLTLFIMSFILSLYADIM